MLKIFETHIGLKVRAARKALDLTLEEVGKRIGITNQALSAIERGEKNPSRQTLINLARVLKTDFGEQWLADHLSEYQAEDQAVPHYLRSLDEVKDVHLFEQFLQYMYSRWQGNIGKYYPQHSVSLPLKYELKQHELKEIKDASETINVPTHMAPPEKGITAALIQDWFIDEAFIGSGDVVIIMEPQGTPVGKTILAFVNDEYLIRRCVKRGRKVALLSLIDGHEPIVATLKQFVFVAEITGLIRFYQRS
jgi:transcriptional regulator with XRE-family HTH domain